MTSNVAASVHQRLLNQAREKGYPFNELLQYYVLERFLYRMGQSAYSRQLVLKGALMFGVWHGAFSRPTRDIDLMGYMDNRVDSVIRTIREICQVPVLEDDGLCFDTDNIIGETITEGAQYQGVRVRLDAKLGSARIRLQVDAGFGDILVPGPVLVQLPVILDFPVPQVLGYTRESAIAEKYQAIVYLGSINSRMKDFYDIWFLASRFTFDGSILAQAVCETFRQRQTPLQAAPVAFTAAFRNNTEKQTQWIAFLRRISSELEAPPLDSVIQVISDLLQPVTRALIDGREFDKNWSPVGNWQ